MQAAISFSMLNFSKATLAQSIASCCISSFISACLMTAFLSAVVMMIFKYQIFEQNFQSNLYAHFLNVFLNLCLYASSMLVTQAQLILQLFFSFFILISMNRRRQQAKNSHSFSINKAFKKLLFISTSYGLSQFDSNHWRFNACIKNPCLKPNTGVFTKSQSIKKIGPSASGHCSVKNFNVPSIRQQYISICKKKIISKQNCEKSITQFNRYQGSQNFDQYELFESIKQCKNQKSCPRRVYQKYQNDNTQIRYKYQIKTQTNQISSDPNPNSIERLKISTIKVGKEIKRVQSRRPLTSEFKNSHLKKAILQNQENLNRKSKESSLADSSNYQFNPWDVESFQCSQLEH